MSRTHHVRPKKDRRPGDTTSNKKPDETRRWLRRFRKCHDIQPPAAERRIDDGETDE